MSIINATQLINKYKVTCTCEEKTCPHSGLYSQAITCGPSSFIGNYNFPTEQDKLLELMEAILTINSTSGHFAPFQQSYRGGFAQRLIVDIDAHNNTATEWYKPINMAVIEAFKFAFPRATLPRWRFAVKRDINKGACIYYDVVLDGFQCKALLKRAAESIEGLPQGVFDADAAGRRILGTRKSPTDSAYSFLPWGKYPQDTKARCKTTPASMLWSLPYVKNRSDSPNLITAETHHLFETEVSQLRAKKRATTGEVNLDESQFEKYMDQVKKEYDLDLELKVIQGNCAFLSEPSGLCPFHNKVHDSGCPRYYIIVFPDGWVRFGCWYPEKKAEWLVKKTTLQIEQDTSPDLGALLAGDTEVGHRKLIIERLKGKFFVSCDKYMHLFSEERFLYLQIDRDDLSSVIALTLSSIINSTIADISERLSIKGDEKLESTRKTLIANLRKWTSINHAKNVAVHVITHFKKTEESEEFYSRLLNDDEYTANFFPVTGGLVVDLRTGEINKRTHKHFFTSESPYLPFSTDEEDAFVEKVMGEIMGTPEKTKYLQTLCGYYLNGEKVQKRFDVFYGPGDTGKSTVLALLGDIMGPLQTSINSKALEKCNHKGESSKADPEIANLYTKRLAHTNELEDGSRLYSSLVKRLTSAEDVVTARLLYVKQALRFVNKAKLVVASNYRPDFDVDDSGLANRMRYLDFDIQFPEPNRYDPTNPNHRVRIDGIKRLISKGAFLKWCIEGSKRYYREGLFEPECVVKLKNEIVGDMDTVQRFINDRLVALPGSFVTVQELWEIFSNPENEYCTPLVSHNSVFSAKLQAKLKIKTSRKKIEGKEKMVLNGFKLK